MASADFGKFVQGVVDFHNIDPDAEAREENYRQQVIAAKLPKVQGHIRRLIAVRRVTHMRQIREKKRKEAEKQAHKVHVIATHLPKLQGLFRKKIAERRVDERRRERKEQEEFKAQAIKYYLPRAQGLVRRMIAIRRVMAMKAHIVAEKEEKEKEKAARRKRKEEQARRMAALSSYAPKTRKLPPVQSVREAEKAKKGRKMVNVFGRYIPEDELKGDASPPKRRSSHKNRDDESYNESEYDNESDEGGGDGGRVVLGGGARHQKNKNKKKFSKQKQQQRKLRQGRHSEEEDDDDDDYVDGEDNGKYKKVLPIEAMQPHENWDDNFSILINNINTVQSELSRQRKKLSSNPDQRDELNGAIEGNGGPPMNMMSPGIAELPFRRGGIAESEEEQDENRDEDTLESSMPVELTIEEQLQLNHLSVLFSELELQYASLEKTNDHIHRALKMSGANMANISQERLTELRELIKEICNEIQIQHAVQNALDNVQTTLIGAQSSQSLAASAVSTQNQQQQQQQQHHHSSDSLHRDHSKESSLLDAPSRLMAISTIQQNAQNEVYRQAQRELMTELDFGENRSNYSDGFGQDSHMPPTNGIEKQVDPMDATFQRLKSEADALLEETDKKLKQVAVPQNGASPKYKGGKSDAHIPTHGKNGSLYAHEIVHPVDSIELVYNEKRQRSDPGPGDVVSGINALLVDDGMTTKERLLRQHDERRESVRSESERNNDSGTTPSTNSSSTAVINQNLFLLLEQQEQRMKNIQASLKAIAAVGYEKIRKKVIPKDNILTRDNSMRSLASNESINSGLSSVESQARVSYKDRHKGQRRDKRLSHDEDSQESEWDSQEDSDGGDSRNPLSKHSKKKSTFYSKPIKKDLYQPKHRNIDVLEKRKKKKKSTARGGVQPPPPWGGGGGGGGSRRKQYDSNSEDAGESRKKKGGSDNKASNPYKRELFSNLQKYLSTGDDHVDRKEFAELLKKTYKLLKTNEREGSAGSLASNGSVRRLNKNGSSSSINSQEQHQHQHLHNQYPARLSIPNGYSESSKSAREAETTTGGEGRRRYTTTTTANNNNNSADGGSSDTTHLKKVGEEEAYFGGSGGVESTGDSSSPAKYAEIPNHSPYDEQKKNNGKKDGGASPAYAKPTAAALALKAQRRRSSDPSSHHHHNPYSVQAALEAYKLPDINASHNQHQHQHVSSNRQLLAHAADASPAITTSNSAASDVGVGMGGVSIDAPTPVASGEAASLASAEGLHKNNASGSTSTVLPRAHMQGMSPSPSKERVIDISEVGKHRHHKVAKILSKEEVLAEKRLMQADTYAAMRLLKQQQKEAELQEIRDAYKKTLEMKKDEERSTKRRIARANYSFMRKVPEEIAEPRKPLIEEDPLIEKHILRMQQAKIAKPPKGSKPLDNALSQRNKRIANRHSHAVENKDSRDPAVNSKRSQQPQNSQGNNNKQQERQQQRQHPPSSRSNNAAAAAAAQQEAAERKVLQHREKVEYKMSGFGVSADAAVASVHWHHQAEDARSRHGHAAVDLAQNW